MRLTLIVFSIMFRGFAQTVLGGESLTLGEVFPASGGTPAAFNVERGVKETERGYIYFERYSDRNGQPAVSIQATYEMGSLLAVRFDQHQLGETSTAEISDGKIHYAHTSGGKTKQSTEKDPGDLVGHPAIPHVISVNWGSLLAGKPLVFTMPIPARRQSFSVKVSQNRTWTEGRRTFTEFKAEPANPIFRTLADPNYYVFDHQGKTLTEVRGSMLVKTGTPGNWKDLTGRIVYQPVSAAD